LAPKYSARVRNKSPYALADGTAIPGVTTILRVLDKSTFLVPWAAKLAFQGVDPIKYRDEKAMIGTLAHAMCLTGLKGETPETYDNSQREIDQAENAYLKFCAWQKAHTLEPIMVEKGMVSDVHRFGGTPDYYGLVDGVLTLMDLKTGNIYPEMWFQMAAYNLLLEEQGKLVNQRILLNIGRDETENFVEAKRSGPALEDEKEIFLACLQIYNCKKRLKYD
jgi:hypothetical protein